MIRLTLWALLVAGCGDSSSNLDAAVPDMTRPVGVDTSVALFDKTLFDSGHQQNEVTVTFPEGLYAKATLHVELGCPNNRCDWWDRLATIGMVIPGGADGGADQVIELGRYVTPYRVGGAWTIDLTDLMPLLHGERTIRAHIGTWVSAGSSSGDGWLLTSRVEMVGGVPDPEPLKVSPLAWRDVLIGDPAQPISASLPTAGVAMTGVSRLKVRVLVTGHGQGNRDNCAEFCGLDHTLLVDGQPAATRNIWRDDCAANPVKTQKGTWQLERAGWCPGADVRPWTIDLGARPESFTLDYAIDSYINSCRPDSCDLIQCALGTGCAYDGGNHTPPNYALSAVVIGYR
jgi:hypothetical protein